MGVNGIEPLTLCL